MGPHFDAAVFTSCCGPIRCKASWAADLGVTTGPPRPVRPGNVRRVTSFQAPDNATGASRATPRAGLPPAGRIVLRAEPGEGDQVLCAREPGHLSISARMSMTEYFPIPGWEGVPRVPRSG